MPLRQCPSLYSILSRIYLAPVEKLFLRQSQCGYIVNSPLVCCTTPDLKSLLPKPSENILFETEEVRLDIEPSMGRLIKANELPQPGECGGEEEVVVGFVVGGKQTKISESPWMALLKYSKCKKIIQIIYVKPMQEHPFHCS